MDISKNIQKHRQSENLTQEQLAEKVAVTRQAVSRWENGDSLPDINMVTKLANLFCITTDELLGVDSRICQSCGAVVADLEERGTEENGEKSPIFCSHCRKNGQFTHDEKMEELAQRNTNQLVSFLTAIHHPAYPEIILKSYLDYLPTLQRWSKQ